MTQTHFPYQLCLIYIFNFTTFYFLCSWVLCQPENTLYLIILVYCLFIFCLYSLTRTWTSYLLPSAVSINPVHRLLWWGRRDWTSGRRKRKRKREQRSKSSWVGMGAKETWQSREKEVYRVKKGYRVLMFLERVKKSWKCSFIILIGNNVCIFVMVPYIKSSLDFTTQGLGLVRTLSSAEMLMSVSPSIKTISKIISGFL